MDEIMEGILPMDAQTREATGTSERTAAARIAAGQAVDYLNWFTSGGLVNGLDLFVNGAWRRFINPSEEVRNAIFQYFLNPSNLILYVWYNTQTGRVSHAQFRYRPGSLPQAAS
ncbi:MAG: hypothetical protein D6730_01045 [Bacteroidetes bacterium]|nr:MAG: hypothetical protein D6730_01045 [Bacteroidota bacterium]